MVDQWPDRRVASQCPSKTDRLTCRQISTGGTCAAPASRVLRRGLPPLPGKLTYQMSIPVAYWTANLRAVVLFLGFSWWEDEEEWFPEMTMATFTRDGDSWTSPKHWMGTGWSHDPIANPRSRRDLGAGHGHRRGQRDRHAWPGGTSGQGDRPDPEWS
jgi:hypothetical protein